MQWFSNFSGIAEPHPKVFWVRRSRQGPETFCFWQVPRWCWYCWSGDHTLRTTLVTFPSFFTPHPYSWPTRPCISCLPLCPRSHVPVFLIYWPSLWSCNRPSPSPISGPLHGMSSPDVSSGQLLQPQFSRPSPDASPNHDWTLPLIICITFCHITLYTMLICLSSVSSSRPKECRLSHHCVPSVTLVLSKS